MTVHPQSCPKLARTTPADIPSLVQLSQLTRQDREEDSVFPAALARAVVAQQALASKPQALKYFR